MKMKRPRIRLYLFRNKVHDCSFREPRPSFPHDIGHGILPHLLIGKSETRVENVRLKLNNNANIVQNRFTEALRSRTDSIRRPGFHLLFDKKEMNYSRYDSSICDFRVGEQQRF